MTIAFTAYLNYTGDVQIDIKGITYFDYKDLYASLDNYDIVREDQQVTVVEGAMTKQQFDQLRAANNE